MLRNALSVQVFIGHLPFSLSFPCVLVGYIIEKLLFNLVGFRLYVRHIIPARAIVAQTCAQLWTISVHACIAYMHLATVLSSSADSCIRNKSKSDGAYVRDLLQGTGIRPLKRDFVCYKSKQIQCSICHNQMMEITLIADRETLSKVNRPVLVMTDQNKCPMGLDSSSKTRNRLQASSGLPWGLFSTVIRWETFKKHPEKFRFSDLLWNSPGNIEVIHRLIFQHSDWNM